MGYKVEFVSWTPDIQGDQVYYLSTEAYNWYKNNTSLQIKILKSGIPDYIIDIFHATNAITVKEGSTYQELLQYFKSLGFTDEQAVLKAQSSIGISREIMIDSLDKLQQEVIEAKAASILEAQKAIQTQVYGDRPTELDLSFVAKVNDLTQYTVKTDNLPLTTGDQSVKQYNLTTTNTNYTPKTVETPKENIEKTLEKSFIETHATHLIALGIISATILGIVAIKRKK